MVDETLQNLAFELTDEAENYLDNGNYSEAILKFQQALDLFQKAGLDAIKFEKARQMILKRQKKAMDLSQDKKKKDTTQKQEVSIPLSKSPGDNQNLVNEGLDLLEDAENLLDEGKYNEAVQYFYSASEILKNAGWTQDQLKNIQNVVDTILEMLGQSGVPEVVKSQESTQPESMFVPTFMKTDQKDIIQPNNKHPQTKGSKPYIPSYIKVQGEQPDFIPEQERRHQVQRDQPGYQPSFLKSGQEDYTPQEKANNQKGTNKSKGGYIPTFAKQELSSAEFDGRSVKKALNLVQEGKPVDFDEISSNFKDGESAPIAAPIVEQKLSPNTPMFIIVEKRKSVEEKAKNIMNLFKKKQDEQNSNLQSVFEIIDQIRDNEQDRKFNLAISQLSSGIEKIKEIPGWTDQATVLYAWLLVLKEKQRINFDPKDENVIFDFGRIRSEFNKIMDSFIQ